MRQVSFNRQRVPMNDKGFDELIVKLYRKKQADICLKRNKRSNQRIFL